MKNTKSSWMQRRRRLSEILEAGSAADPVSRGYDVFSTLMTLTNVVVTVMYTFDKMELNHGSTLLMLEAVTVAFFAVEYFLRLWTAQFIHPNLPEWQAVKKYATSFSGVIDLLSFLTICLFSSPWAQPYSGCSGWCASSGCSTSMPTMTL